MKNNVENPKGLIFRHRVLWHILFWLFSFLFYSLTYGSYSGNYIQEFLSNLFLLPVRILGTYTLIYWLIPSLLLRKKYTVFAVLTMLHAILFGFALWLVLYFFVYCQGCIYEANYPLLYLPKIFALIITNYEIPAIAAVIVIFKRWYAEAQRTRELEKDKLQAELQFLKSQIHPHFLFNTLNNLYALALKKSDKTPDVVIRLSEMLDYMLYQSNEPEVKLAKEIELIKAYLELESIRYGKRLDLRFDIEGDPGEKRIAPLLLLPFVENSFKHGASNNINKPFIHIKLGITHQWLLLTVANSFGEQTKESYSEGIGLKNVQRRLDLLYNGRHQLDITRNEGVFNVSFRLNWNDSI